MASAFDKKFTVKTENFSMFLKINENFASQIFCQHVFVL
jgi:hypothetical protein